jgi:autotransporter translocation and assembly factor TamB
MITTMATATAMATAKVTGTAKATVAALAATTTTTTTTYNNQLNWDLQAVDCNDDDNDDNSVPVGSGRVGSGRVGSGWGLRRVSRKGNLKKAKKSNYDWDSARNTNCKREGGGRLHNNQPNMTMTMTMKRTRTRTRMMSDNKYDNNNHKGLNI